MKSTSPVPIWAILLTLVACGAVLYVIMPDQTSVLARLIRDGKVGRAYEVWKTVPAAEIARDPGGHALTGLRLERQLLRKDYDENLQKLLKKAWKGYQQYSLQPEFAHEITALIAAGRQPYDVFEVVGPALQTCRAEDREPFMRALVKNALEYGQPDIAAMAYERCWKHLAHTEENLSEYVRMWRYADEQEKALHVLEQFEREDNKNLFTFSYALGRLRIDLLRELGQNEEAFERFHPVVARAAIPPLKSDLQVLRATASDPAQQKKLLVEYHRYLKANPDDLETWKRLGEIAVFCDDFATAQQAYQKLTAVPVPDSADVRSLAQIFEWTTQPARAFDLYLRLAEKGDNAALDRMVELNPGLYRDKDLMRVIHEWHGERQVRDYHLLLARLLTKHGQYPEAERYFETYIREHPKDIAALEDYGAMLKRQFAYARALPIYTRLAELAPTNQLSKKTLAQLHYLLGDFPASLRHYKELAASSEDPEVLEKFANLGESLGHFGEVAGALSRRMKIDPEASDSSYLKLAYIYGLADAPQEQARALRDGLKRFPGSHTLQLQLAVVMVEQKQRDRAIKILAAHPQLKTNLFALSLYLNLLVESRNYVAAQSFIKSVPEHMLTLPHVVLLCALVAEGSGDYAAAERYYKTLHQEDPEVRSYGLSYANVLARREKFSEAAVVLRKLLRNPTPDLLSEAARLFNDMGDFRQAEQLQRKYLQSRTDVPFREWTYLGDICSAAGNRTGAREAYARALTILQGQVKKQ